ncbi:MAG TPA: ABC transporter permease [Elusimicrobia bacterium]|jgi:ABC-type lipoprotein release transport system permease subunit|nr:ABC transporter permease [Elusimicrobiota bacterium]
MLLKLAYRNLIGAKLRTVLNVGVLSLTYVLIIWHQGLFSGMYRQATRDVIKDEIAGGQYWHKNYDPYDVLSLDEGHGSVPQELKPLIAKKKALPILIRQANLYSKGRVQSVLIKGIDPGQKILDIPTAKLDSGKDILPVMVGKIMARKNSLKLGDSVTIRWRDAYGTFDAVEGEIVEIMNTNVPTIDNGQIWLPLERLRKMTGLTNQATIIVVGKEVVGEKDLSDWQFRNQDFLLKDVSDVVKSKRTASAIMYLVLLFLIMLAIFDTQVLSIFRRRKEIGTLMALGMTRLKVILLFTIEGTLNGILGIGVAAIYGTPVLIYTANTGIPLPQAMEEYGFALKVRMFPVYSAWLITGTVLIVMLTVTIVSYLPSRRISGLKPTEALKGKIG